MMRSATRSTGAVLMLVLLTVWQNAAAAQTPPTESRIEGDSQLEVAVGMTGFVKQLVLPGTEVSIREVDPRRTPVALRIDQVYPHGEGFRYDLTFFGLEPGEHNLSEYLVRKDGTSVADLPDIIVTVNSILPADQLRPSAPPTGFIARIGGYHVAVMLAAVAWLAGLLAIIFWGRNRQRRAGADTTDSSLTDMDHIRLLVDQAMQAGELSVAQKADLDMRILNFWRARRDLADVSVSDALVQLKSDEQAGPLLSGLERWFYGREVPHRNDIVDLLEPMAELAAQQAAMPGNSATAAQPAGDA